MCSSPVRIVLFACVFGVITILLTLSIISGLYLFVVSWSGVCQETPESCQEVAKECSILSGCDYLVASTSILSLQSGLIIICFYSLICFYATLKQNTGTILDREPSQDLPTLSSWPIRLPRQRQAFHMSYLVTKKLRVTENV